MVCFGPARSDPAHWNFETEDIAAFLKKGKNIVSATVWNFGEYRAYAQTSYETAFLLQGNSETEFPMNTGEGWKVIMDSSYQPLPIDREALRSYVAVTSGESVDGNRYAWNHEREDGTHLRWLNAKVLWYPAKPRTYGTDGNWFPAPYHGQLSWNGSFLQSVPDT
jgi:alpha-L-rhamnosidase